MMGSEHQSFQEAHLYASQEEMENLVLDNPLDISSNSYSNYRNAMSMLSEARHPLSPSIVATSADSHPLLSPPHYNEFENANAHDNSDPEPPASYKDVIFSPLDGDNAYENTINGEEFTSSNSTSYSSLSPSRSPSSSSEYIKITVSDPVKEQEMSNSIVLGSNSFVTYLITTKTNIPVFGKMEFSVRRRFRDVVTLSDRLAESYRGFFIPARPDKSIVESRVKQKQEFVEQRRVALEKYLRRLAAHPVIRKSDEFKVFLQVHGRLPLPVMTDVAARVLDGAAKLPKQLLGENVIQPQEVVQPVKGGRDFMRMFKEMKQAMAKDWGGFKPPVVEEDKEFLEKKERMQEFEQQINSATQQAESLVKAQKDLGETMGEMGLAFMKLAKFENEETVFNSQRVRANEMKNVATAAVKASRLYKGLRAETAKQLDTLHDYQGIMFTAHAAFSKRSSALLTVQTLLSELSSLESRAEKHEAASSKIFGTDKSRIRKLELIKETIRATEDAKNVAIREYERIKENNKTELERLDRGWQADFANMFKGFVVSQVDYAEKIANVWTKVAEETSGYANDSS